MDNITHTLTGAIISKSGPVRHHTRLIFWSTLLAVNIPDVDFLLQFFGDRMFYMEHHRGLSHSVLFAPFFAGIVAGILSVSVRGIRFRNIYPYIFVGILIHILFDLITSFGTMLFYPLTNRRFSLDLIFIIDPWITVPLLAAAVLARKFKNYRKTVIRSSIAFVLLYFSAAFLSREAVRSNAEDYFIIQGIEYREIVVIPQPFAFTNWAVLIRTDESVYQIFTNVFEKPADYTVYDYPYLEPNEFIIHAETTPEVEFFRWFSRMPVYDYYDDGSVHYVEYYDLQFDLNPKLAERFGIRGEPPFVLRLKYDNDGTKLDYDF